ncbi:MAG: hypothetical protein N2484_10060 [Clostridia bacterium]|nr:hypothetical protein [Clostridia bacterium]
MMIIKIRKRSLYIILTVILTVCLGTICFVSIHKTDKDSYNLSIIQIPHSNVEAFLSQSLDTGNENKVVEIFDISKGEVIKTEAVNPSIRKEAEKYLNSITGMFVKVKAIPEKGYILRIPLEPPVEVKSHWLADYGINSVEELFVLLPEQGTPYLLVLDDQSRPYFYNFDGNIEPLLERLGFPL